MIAFAGLSRGVGGRGCCFTQSSTAESSRRLRERNGSTDGIVAAFGDGVGDAVAAREGARSINIARDRLALGDDELAPWPLAFGFLGDFAAADFFAGFPEMPTSSQKSKTESCFLVCFFAERAFVGERAVPVSSQKSKTLVSDEDSLSLGVLHNSSLGIDGLWLSAHSRSSTLTHLNRPWLCCVCLRWCLLGQAGVTNVQS
jgi:hypothetical protein